MTIVLPVSRAGATLRDDEEREVPGNDATDDADGVPEEKDLLVGPVAGDDLALEPPGPLGHVVDVVGREASLHPGEAEDLALLFGDHLREVLGILPERGSDLAQVPGALDGRQLLPAALRLLGGADRLSRVLERRVRDLGDDLPG